MAGGCRGLEQQSPALFEGPARIDADGTLVARTGECKEGMGLSYNGVWGYHPLVVSLANTGESLFIIHRPGNRPSHEGAAEYFTRAITVVRLAGWKDVLLRGDTDFSQTAHLDGWDDDGARFVFGYLQAQLKGGVRALRGPLNTLNANWAYMAIVALAWSLKAWVALTCERKF